MNCCKRLVKRNNVYYIRVRIPDSIKHLAKTAQYFYSLKTYNYYEALAKAREESYKIDLKINLLKGLDMKIKNGELLLDDVDIDRLVVYRLKDVEKVFENRYDEICDGKFDMTPLKIFSPEKMESAKVEIKSNDTPSIELKCVEMYLKEYFDDLKYNKTQSRSQVKLVGRIEKEEIPIISDFKNPSEWVRNTKTALRGIDRYIDGKTQAYHNGEDFTGGINPKVKRCLKIVEDDKNKKVRSQRTTQTPWEKTFANFTLSKQNQKGVINTTINGNKSCLNTIFTILQKTNLEEITRRDCRFINDYIYYLPKHWEQKYKAEQLRRIVESKSCANKISLTSAKKYLRTFREFMIFCKKRDVINESFIDDIEIPQRKEEIIVDGFTPDELKTIFNPSTYPRKNNIYYGYRYWIPLISLYSSCRLNEICQLYVDDIKYENKIWYFNINDEFENQHLKNKTSKRKIPVHPKLIELGFIDFVKEVRKSKKDRLFYQLTYKEKTRYTHMMGSWFGRYMSSIHIEGRNKVFHSFRHTVKPYLRDCGIPQEYQNAICGWAAKDIGERVYGGEIPVKRLYEEISKLDYPFLNKTLDELKILNEKGE